jgi:hypothetical protein
LFVFWCNSPNILDTPRTSSVIQSDILIKAWSRNAIWKKILEVTGRLLLLPVWK